MNLNAQNVLIHDLILSTVCVSITFQIVQEVSESNDKSFIFPTVNMIVTPPMKMDPPVFADYFLSRDVSKLCPNTTEYKTCFEDLFLGKRDIIQGMTQKNFYTYEYKNLDLEIQQYLYSLFLGNVITHHKNHVTKSTHSAYYIKFSNEAPSNIILAFFGPNIVSGLLIINSKDICKTPTNILLIIDLWIAGISSRFQLLFTK